MSLNLEGKTAIVTGASSGLGRLRTCAAEGGLSCLKRLQIPIDGFPFGGDLCRELSSFGLFIRACSRSSLISLPSGGEWRRT